MADALEQGLTADAFFLSDHRRVFDAILLLKARHAPVDFCSVLEQLGNSQDDAGLLGSLINGAVIPPGNIRYHVKTVLNKFRLRQLVTLGDWLCREATACESDPKELSHTVVRLESL